jgi:hypothetical protein
MDKRRIAENIYTFVCDDIRHEIGNKMSLMGLYDDIVVRHIPMIIPKINFALLLKGVKIKIRKINVSLKHPDGEIIQIPEVSLPPNLKIGSNHNIDLCVAPLKISKPGKFTWEIRIDGEEKPSITHILNVITASEAK